MSGTLYVVGTPIGNLSDFPHERSKRCSEVDFIAAEDTRVTQKLLSHFQIKKPMISYYQHNLREKGRRNSGADLKREKTVPSPPTPVCPASPIPGRIW